MTLPIDNHIISFADHTYAMSLELWFNYHPLFFIAGGSYLLILFINNTPHEVTKTYLTFPTDSPCCLT